MEVVMLRRKMEEFLNKWKSTPGHKPLVIKGCRQCGKTWVVRHFAEQNYKKVVYMNFLANKELATIFSGSLQVDHLIMLISAAYRISLIPGETILIFDEIQDCPEARTALKFFQIDGRFDIIATGSLLGVSGYRKQPSSVPVGYEHIVEMHPLDFEEFLWANGISKEIFDYLKKCLRDISPVPEALHRQFKELLLQYTVVGGMPAVVQEFVNTKDVVVVAAMQRDIVSEYKDDMIKYAEIKSKSLIRQCFDSIPQQLAKENKKFQYSLVKKNGTSAMFEGILQWLTDAGIAAKCYNVHCLELPLTAQSMNDVFKLYMCDTGLFVSMLDDGTQLDILQGNMLGYKGAIFENLIADIFGKMGRKLYYYRKDSGLEIDFVIRYKGKCTLVEVKATTGNAKSLNTVLHQAERHHVYEGIKLGDYNIGYGNQVLTLPLYMAFLLTDL